VDNGDSEARHKEISTGALPEFFNRGEGYGPEDVHNLCLILKIMLLKLFH
jgi:hypothetical protein